VKFQRPSITDRLQHRTTVPGEKNMIQCGLKHTRFETGAKTTFGMRKIRLYAVCLTGYCSLCKTAPFSEVKDGLPFVPRYVYDRTHARPPSVVLCSNVHTALLFSHAISSSRPFIPTPTPSHSPYHQIPSFYINIF
jgi:hypothetical protein